MRNTILLLCSALILVTVNASPTYDNSFYYKHWCGAGLRYLEDKNCIKKFPSSFDRNWVSPLLATAKTTSGYVPDSGKFSDFQINTTVLGSYIANHTNACVILIKRTTQGTVYKYYCGEGDDKNAYQPW